MSTYNPIPVDSFSDQPWYSSFAVPRLSAVRQHKDMVALTNITGSGLAGLRQDALELKGSQDAGFTKVADALNLLHQDLQTLNSKDTTDAWMGWQRLELKKIGATLNEAVSKLTIKPPAQS